MAKLDLDRWLESLGLGRYAEAFRDNDIDEELLRELTADDLKELGVASLGHRKTLMAAIGKLAGASAAEESEEAVGTKTEAAVLPAGERRQVTVLFADLSGFTELSSALGAEDTHALLNSYFEAVDGVVADYGGSVDKHIGDSVMALFGAPVAHSNDPERAVRASFDIHAAMGSLGAKLGRDLKAHIGIASGQVVASGTGSAAHREYTVTGDTVNLASRLQDRAGPGETLISDRVLRAVAPLVDARDLGEIQVKGFAAPVPVSRVDGLRAAPAGRSAAPLVGRRPELRQFTALAEDCLEGAAGHSLLVRGEAGIGKTRLIDEFGSVAEGRGFAVHRGLVLDFGVGQGQDAIRTLVRSLLAIPAGSGKKRRQEAADAAVRDTALDPDLRVFLNDLLDLPQPVELRSRYDAMDGALRNEGKREAVSALVRAAAARRPLLLAVEDVHWADALTLAHLANLAATVADCAGLLVMTSRIEGDPLDQAWRASRPGGRLTTIDLGPLRQDEAKEIAANLLSGSGALLEDCVEKADGNPLFLEQLLRNAEEGASEDVPGSIQSLVQARMDRLPAKDKLALQAASVIGQRFDLDALRQLLDDPDYGCGPLLEHHLVSPRGEGYLFAHALICDGVYASLLKARRRELHQAAARWFAAREPVLRAEHLERAEDPGAAMAFLLAAEREAVAYHYERALELIARGLALATDDGERSRLMCMRGDLLHDSGESQASLDAYLEARSLAADDPQHCKAEIGYAAVMRILDRYDEAFTALERAEPIARKHGLHLELARLHHLRGNLYFPLGEIERCREQHGAALERAREAESPDLEARALGGLADAAYARGRHLSADRDLKLCLELCRRHGFGRIEVAYLSMTGGGGTGFYQGDLERALSASLGSEAQARAVGHDRAEIIAQAACYICLFAMGETERARQHVERAKELVEKIGARRFMARALQYEGKIELANGNRQEALDRLRTAMAISRETGIQYAGPSILGDMAFATGDAGERDVALDEGERLLREGSLSHNHFEFAGMAIETCLKWQDWDGAERYAAQLEDYTREEPLAYCTLLIARGRALAAFGRGRRDEEGLGELRRLREEAARMGFRTALPALDAALA